ncbi:hypothetical protein V8E55_005771 [Tylopilus felleus]
MASMCTVHGVISISKGQVFEYAEKTYSSHDAFLPLPDSENDFAFTIFTFGRNPFPLYDGIYIISGRVVQARSVLSSKSSVAPVLHVFVNDKPIELSTGICAPPIFVVTGHSHSVPLAVPRITSSTFRFQRLPRSDARTYHCSSTFSESSLCSRNEDR